MDYTKLEELVEKEDVSADEIFAFYGVKNKAQMEALIVKNLEQIKVVLNDTLGYISPELIYQYSVVENHNVFYERLMTISFFLRAFADYETNIIKSFVESVGVINFVFLAEKVLSNKEEFNFFKDAYESYKRDKYYREQTEKVFNMFENMAEQIESVNFSEIKELVDKIGLQDKKS